MDTAPSGRDCAVEAVGKQRNGKPRFWCMTHQSSATGKYGRRLERCEGAYRAADRSQATELDPAAYPGGLALWGAVKPVYDTSRVGVEEGVHVHAREEVNGDKVIDGTFSTVTLPLMRNLFDASKALITVETAVASYVSRFLDRPMMSLFCTYCGEPHLDSEWFAVKPHKRHLCHNCGKIFPVNERCISNPLVSLRHMLRDRGETRSLEPAVEELDLKQADYPGGLQIWASNEALLWTSPEPEKEGIHVHAYAADGVTRLIDDTYAEVTIDGTRLDKDHLRYFMAQQALKYLDGKVVSLRCTCGEAYFDAGEAAFRPHSDHRCKRCDTHLRSKGRRKKVVSNPFVDTVAVLRALAA